LADNFLFPQKISCPVLCNDRTAVIADNNLDVDVGDVIVGSVSGNGSTTAQYANQNKQCCHCCCKFFEVFHNILLSFSQNK